MQNLIRRVIVLAAATLALSPALTACTGSNGYPVVTKTMTVTKTVTAAPAPKPAQSPTHSASTDSLADQEQTGKQVLAYLTSKERATEFKRIAPKAGIKIAQALQAGKFGKVFRYDGNKVALQPHETGWGGISTLNSSKIVAFAWVYWKADGSIDYTKPITQVALTAKTDSTHATAVNIFGPNSAGFDYWNVAMASGKKTEVDPTLFTGSATLGPEDANFGNFFEPTDLAGVTDLDTRALNQFIDNMNSWFGPSWNK